MGTLPMIVWRWIEILLKLKKEWINPGKKWSRFLESGIELLVPLASEIDRRTKKRNRKVGFPFLESVGFRDIRKSSRPLPAYYPSLFLSYQALPDF
jgi:hypothetical protein